jgi:hypothetical protein
MPAVYLCDVIGDGTRTNGYRPNVPAGTPFVCIMIDTDRGKSIIATRDVDLAGDGIRLLVSGDSWPELRANAQATRPGAAARTVVNTWLGNGGYETLPTGARSWAQIILFVARQVDTAADLDGVEVN